jgi:hypothetical protein
MPLQIRRGNTAQRQAIVPQAGELVYDTDLGTIYVGDGETAGGIASVNITPRDVRDQAAGIFTSGSHTGISFTYNGTAGTIDAVVDPDLSNYQGVIRASAFNGSLVADDSSLLVDALHGYINLNGTVKGNIVPDADSAYDIGTSGLRFKDLYLSGSSLHLGTATITSVGSAVNLPAGSTVGGVAIGSGGTGDGVIAGMNYNINIVGDDSTLIVNATTKSITAAGGFTGNLLGNTTGDHNGYVYGDVAGNVTGNLTGDVLGNVTGNVKGNVLATDSTTAYNATTKVFTGNLTGDVTGNITGDVTTTTLSVNGPFLTIENSVNTDISTIVRNIPEPGNHTDVNAITDGVYSTGTSYYISRGTLGTPTAVQTADRLVADIFFAHDGSNYVPACIMGMGVDPFASVTTGAVPGGISFTSISDGNITHLTKTFLMDSRGYVGINNGFNQPGATLDVNGFAKLAVLTSAPATPAEGMIAIADGTSWNPMGTGKKVVVAYLAGGWRQMATAP